MGVSADQVIIASLLERAAALEADAAALRRGADIIQRGVGAPDHSAADHAPAVDHATSGQVRRRTDSATTLTLELVRSEPHREWTVQEAYDALVSRGYESGAAKDPPNAIRTALARLAGRGLLERVSSGVYRLKPNEGNNGNGAVPAPTQTPGGDSHPDESQVFDAEH